MLTQAMQSSPATLPSNSNPLQNRGSHEVMRKKEKRQKTRQEKEEY
jgi:hypothetical protein